MKYYLVTYQQRTYGRENWTVANDVATDPGQWLLQVKSENDAEAATVLLSATEITEAAYEKLKDEL